jgi:serine/threonine protein kinase
MTSQDSRISRNIGNYHIIRELASGASGCVYLAQHTLLTKRIVAIKLLHITHLGSPEERADFLREAQFLEELKHPYILPIFDVGIEDGFPYIVAEYAPNGSLRNRIKRHAPDLVPLEEILTILTQVGQALQHAHQQHIIHRDLKPENILFNANNEALLADFGLATSLSTASIKRVDQSGTPRYMAPEQFQGQVSKESDEYSLACIAYELVTGHQPFIANDFYALGFKHLTEQPIPPTQFNPHLPAAVEQVILKAMAKQRVDRYRDISSFISALAQAASSQPYPLASSQTHTPALSASSVNKQDSTGTQTLPVDQTPPFSHRDPITPLHPVQGSGPLSSSGKSEAVKDPYATIPLQESDSSKRTLPVHHHDTVASLSRKQADKQGVTAGTHALANGGELLPASNLAGSNPPLVMKRSASAGQQWLMVAVVCLVIAASILGGFLLVLSPALSTRFTSNGLVSSPSATSGTPGRTPAAKQSPSQPTTPSGQSTSGSGVQTTVTATAQPKGTAQLTPTPTPTSQPPSPTPTSARVTSDTLTVYFASYHAAQSVHSYSGTVRVTVSGSGGVSANGVSDAFYMYTDFKGTLLNPPLHDTQHNSCWVMYINNSPSENFVPTPPYNPNYSYQFTMTAPGGPLSFSICDGNRSDNHGALTVTVTQN